MTTISSGTRTYFSSDHLPEAERLAIYREVFGAFVVKLDLTPIDGRPFRELATFHTFDNLGIGFSETNGNIGIRTKALVADGNDDLVLCTNLGGLSLPSQRGRELTMRAGSATLISLGECGRQDFPEHTRYMWWRIPRRTLGAFVANPEDMLLREVPADNEALRRLIDFTTTTLDQQKLRAPDRRRRFAAAVHDLLALAIGASDEAAEQARAGGLRAARLQAVKADAVVRLGDPGFTVAAAAARQRVTPRYVQALFESEGTTFSSFLLERRLARVNAALRDPQQAGRRISAIAHEAGFGDLSHFNRDFRRRYGASPSDIRAAAGEGE
jgi:AraC-like DNA-binding protein